MSTQGEPDDRGEDDGLARAKRRGKRYALAIFVSFAAAFIVLSTWEIVAGVFALDAPGGVAAHGRLSAACSVPLRAFAAGLERKPEAPDALDAPKGARPAFAPSAPSAQNAQNSAIAPRGAELHAAELGDRTTSLAALDSVCSAGSADLDALAAVKRFVRAADAVNHAVNHAENHKEGDRADAIAPLRRDMEAYLTP